MGQPSKEDPRTSINIALNLPFMLPVQFTEDPRINPEEIQAATDKVLEDYRNAREREETRHGTVANLDMLIEAEERLLPNVLNRLANPRATPMYEPLHKLRRVTESKGNTPPALTNFAHTLLVPTVIDPDIFIAIVEIEDYISTRLTQNAVSAEIVRQYGPPRLVWRDSFSDLID